MLKVETFLLTVKALTDLQDLLKSGQIAALGDSLYEMRIPKTLKGGVVRIYFCHASENPQILFLLEAEFKHDKEAQKIPSARKRLTEYQEIEKRRTR